MVLTMDLKCVIISLVVAFVSWALNKADSNIVKNITYISWYLSIAAIGVFVCRFILSL